MEQNSADFTKLCLRNGLDIKTRYHCVESLNQTINKKRGKFSRDDLNDWLQILNCCLRYDRTVLSVIDVSSHEDKFSKIWAQVQQNNSNNEPYLVSLLVWMRDLFQKAKNASLNTVQEADGIQEIRERLKEFIIEKSGTDVEDGTTFAAINFPAFIQDPFYRYLLPYCLFFSVEVARKVFAIKEERLDETTNAVTPLSFQEINKDSQSVILRSLPINDQFTEDDMKQLIRDFTIAEGFAMKILKEYSYYSIGYHVKEAVCRKNIANYVESDVDDKCNCTSNSSEGACDALNVSGSSSRNNDEIRDTHFCEEEMELRSDIYEDWRNLCDDSAIRYKKICYFYIPLPDIRYILYDVSEIFYLDDNDYRNIQCEFMQALLDQGEYSKKEVWESISDRESSLEWQQKPFKLHEMLSSYFEVCLLQNYVTKNPFSEACLKNAIERIIQFHLAAPEFHQAEIVVHKEQTESDKGIVGGSGNEDDDDGGEGSTYQDNVCEWLPNADIESKWLYCMKEIFCGLNPRQYTDFNGWILMDIVRYIVKIRKLETAEIPQLKLYQYNSYLPKLKKDILKRFSQSPERKEVRKWCCLSKAEFQEIWDCNKSYKLFMTEWQLNNEKDIKLLLKLKGYLWAHRKDMLEFVEKLSDYQAIWLNLKGKQPKIQGASDSKPADADAEVVGEKMFNKVKNLVKELCDKCKLPAWCLDDGTVVLIVAEVITLLQKQMILQIHGHFKTLLSGF